MMMRGLGENSLESSTFLMNCFSICSVTVKSAMTPSFIGRIAVMLPGVRPSICFAARPDLLDHALAVGAALLADRHDRGLVQHDAFAADIDQRVGCSQIDREIAGKIALEEFEHGDFRLEGAPPQRPALL